MVGQPVPQAKDFPTLRLSESSYLLPSFGLSSSSSSPTLPWGTAEDSSPSFSPNWVREGHSQNIPGEGSLFNVSPLSPGLVVRTTREGGAAPFAGVLLPTMLEDFDDSVLGDPITYARIEQLPGSEAPLSLPVYAWPPSSALLMDSFGRCWHRGSPNGLRRGPQWLTHLSRREKTGCWNRDCRVVRTISWSPATSCFKMETRHIVYSYIILAFWS